MQREEPSALLGTRPGLLEGRLWQARRSPTESHLPEGNEVRAAPPASPGPQQRRVRQLASTVRAHVPSTAGAYFYTERRALRKALIQSTSRPRWKRRSRH
uniref:Uncharacterized protein n=1 Tax=Steinernema glaseri TaxID=37863 RepID=A0A1I7XXB3_9BILA